MNFPLLTRTRSGNGSLNFKVVFVFLGVVVFRCETHI